MSEPVNTHSAISWDYTQAPPTGDVADIVGLLNSTPAVLAILGDYLSQNVLTYKLFTQRINAVNGAFAVQKSVAQKAAAISGDTPYGVITPGSDFPLAQTGETTPSMGATVKIAAKSLVTWEDVLAYKRSAVDTALRQLSNSYSDSADTLSVSALVADIPATGTSARTVVAGTTFVGATSADQVLAPLMTARATIKDARLGFRPNAIVMSELNAALLASSAPIQTLLALSRETTTVSDEGVLGKIAGLEVITVPTELTIGNAFESGALVADLALLGGLAETLPLRAQSVFNTPNISPAETWVVSMAHNFAPYVQNPLAGCWVNGIA
jgi:hypothetical protein